MDQKGQQDSRYAVCLHTEGIRKSNETQQRRHIKDNCWVGQQPNNPTKGGLSMSYARSFNDSRRLFDLWKELTGEDLMPKETAVDSRFEKPKQGKIK